RELVHHGVDGVLQLQNLAADVHRDLLGQVAVGDGGGHVGDVPHLRRQVAGHEVHAVGEVLPHPGDARDVGLPAELALGADLPGPPGPTRCEGGELVHHGVDGVLELQNLALDIHRDLAAEVAVGDGRRHRRDVPHLGGEVTRHAVDGVGEVLPGAGDALDPG